MRGTGLRVDARPVAAGVDAADPGREARDERRQDEHERRRRQEAPDDVPSLDQPADGVPEGHGVHSLEARIAGIADRPWRADAAASIALPWTPQPPSPRRAAVVRRADRHAGGPARHRRPRLRRPAARDRVRRGRLRRHRHRPERERVRRSASAAPTSSTCPPSATRPPATASRATTDYAAVSRARRAHDLRPDAALEDAHARHLLHRRRRRVGGTEPARRGSSWSSSRRPIPARPRRSCCRSSSADGAQGRARTSSSATRPSASTPATRPGPIRNTPKLVAGVTEECLRRTELLYRQIVDTVVPGLEPDGRRDGEAAREHLPRGQHRARQRAGADVRPARDLRLGGDRRRRARSRSRSCRTTRARASAATASRSCRTSSPGGCASTATRRS